MMALECSPMTTSSAMKMMKRKAARTLGIRATEAQCLLGDDTMRREILFDYEHYEYRGTSPAPEAGEAEVQIHGHVYQRQSARSHRRIIQQIQTFGVHFGFKNRFLANDVVHAAVALLENTEKDESPGDNFLKALDFLSRYTHMGVEGNCHRSGHPT